MDKFILGISMGAYAVEAIKVGGKGYALDFTVNAKSPSRAVSKSCSKIFRIIGKPRDDVSLEMRVGSQSWEAVFGPLEAPSEVTRGGKSFTVTHGCKKIVRVT